MGVGAIGSQRTAPKASGATGLMPNLPQCALCVASNTKYLFPKHGYAVYQCQQCQLEFLHPQPDDTVLASIYGSNYFLGEPTPESIARVSQLKAATAGLYLDLMSGLLSQPSGRILEVGCGSGDFLAQARQRGFQVEGIEYSAVAAQKANQKLGGEAVQVGTLDTVRPALEAFDAVVACDVIEHVRDPKGFMRQAHACLRPGGLVFLATPSLDSWSRRWMGRHWMEYKIEHLFYFGRASLRLLLASTGFENPSFHSNQKMASFDYVYHHFRTYSVPVLSALFSGVRRLLPGWLSHHPWKIAGSGVIVIAQKPFSEQVKSGI